MREDLKLQASNLDSLVQKLVHDALSKVSGLGAEHNIMDVDSDAGAPRPDLKTDDVKVEEKEAEDNDSAIYRICTEENTLVRLMSRLKLPEELKSKYHQVHSVMDFYLRSLTKYEKLKTVFDSSLEGADLILAVERFREWFRSYKDCVTDELLALTRSLS